MPINPASSPLDSAPSLAQGRDPKVRATPGQPGSLGDQAFKDAVIVVGVAWLILILLSFSLRRFNI